MRVTGLVLLPVIAFELVRQGKTRSDGAWLALIPLPLLGFAAYLQLRTGDALAFLHAESLPSFGEALAWPWDGLRATWTTAATSTDPTNRPSSYARSSPGWLGFAAVIASWIDRRFPRSLALYCHAGVAQRGVDHLLAFGAALRPGALPGGDRRRRPHRSRPAARPVLLVAGAAVLAWGAFVFARGWVDRMIVDAHVHILPDRVRDNLDRASPRREPWFAACHARGERMASAESLRGRDGRARCRPRRVLQLAVRRPGDCAPRPTTTWPPRCAAFPTGSSASASSSRSTPARRGEVQRCAHLGLSGIGEMNADAQGWALLDGRVDPSVRGLRRRGHALDAALQRAGRPRVPRQGDGRPPTASWRSRSATPT